MTPRVARSYLELAKRIGLARISVSTPEGTLEAEFPPPKPEAAAVAAPRTASESAVLREQRDRLRREADEQRRRKAYAHTGMVPVTREN